MADASIPPYGKRQSTGEEKQASKKLKGEESKDEEEKVMADKMQSTGKEKLECGESDEERAEKAMADKMQSTGKEKLECGESDEERAYRAILKLRTVYNEDEEEMSVLEFRRLVMQFKGYYFTDKFVWKKLVEYILEHLPTVIKGRLSRLRPNHYEGWDDENRLLDIYMKRGGEGVKRAPFKEVREVFPPRAYDAGKHVPDSDED